jgi:hypothetical protein
MSRPESLRDQIATIIQTGHHGRKTSDQVAAEICALLAKLGFGGPLS